MATPAFKSAWMPGDSITYFCDPGYVLDGEKVSTCNPDGTWDNDVPSCEGKIYMCQWISHFC